MRVVRALVWLALAAALPAPALAEDTWLVVVPITAGDARTLRATELERLMIDAVTLRRDVRVLSAEDALTGVATVGELESCGADRACFARVLSQTRADLALVVLVNELSSPPLIATRLFDVRSARFLSSAAAPLAPEEGGVRRAVVARAGAQLDAAGFPLMGRLEVEASPADATLWVPTGKPDGDRSDAYVVPAGACTVRAEREGHRPRELTVVVPAGATVRLTVALERERSAVIGSPWFWAAAIGVAAVAGVVATVAATSGRCICLAGQSCDC